MPMTQITLLDAFEHIERLIASSFGTVVPKRLEAPESTHVPADPARAASHVLWIAKEAKQMLASRPEKREKLMRWLAFCQGWAWSTGLASIDELKEMNRPPEE